MKNTVNISLENEKILALKMYLAQKNSSLDDEITKFAEQLYGKVVPQNVRDFIEMTAKRQNVAKPKSVSEKPTNQP
ncbi:MAG: hypothetical protein J6C38_10355 [Oscillospiraceae bacterium]|nr:hypothetical protein [Oscillospiraceae bacterium]